MLIFNRFSGATLHKHQIAISPNKTRLAQTSTRYLGFIISRDGISKDPRITAAIRDFQHPNDLSYPFLKRLRVYIPFWVCVIFIADSFAIMRRRSGYYVI